MIQKDIVITADAGFHARPASIFAKTAMGFKCDIKIINGDKEVNGKSIMSILTLGASKGSSVTLECSGEDENEAVEKLASFIETME
jgi:phosphotransferase system HPr (HPr) family protein